MTSTAYSVQFFSRPSDEDTRPEQAEFGYDGSMTVYELDTEDLAQMVRELDAHATSMDCIYGEVLCVISWPNPHTPSRTLRTAIRFQHQFED